MIYFIQDTGSKAIKIGISQDPNKRLAQLQTAHASELRLIAVMDGNESDEQALHRLFTNRRGEWFDPTHELKAFIRQRTVMLVPFSGITKTRQTSSRREWRPELQGDEYLTSLARLFHHVLETEKGTMTELVGLVYPDYAENCRKYPDVFSPMTQDAFQSQIQRLIDIQNS